MGRLRAVTVPCLPNWHVAAGGYRVLLPAGSANGQLYSNWVQNQIAGCVISTRPAHDACCLEPKHWALDCLTACSERGHHVQWHADRGVSRARQPG